MLDPTTRTITHRMPLAANGRAVVLMTRRGTTTLAVIAPAGRVPHGIVTNTLAGGPVVGWWALGGGA